METETTDTPVTALVKVSELTAVQLFAPGKLDEVLEDIKARVRAIDSDISTEEGRKAIASLAYKISRTKSFIDEQRVSLVADEKKRLAAIDTEGRRVREELDALRDEVRKPLTEWEDAEKQRIAQHELRIASIAVIGANTHATLEDVASAQKDLDRLWDHNFQEFTKRATQFRDKALLHLQDEDKQIRYRDQMRAEEQRVKFEADEKARKEREAQIAEDARLKAEAEAKRREEAQAREAKQREDEAARIAAAEKTRLEREKKEGEERLQKQLDDAKAKAQRDKLAAEERERKAEADRVAAEKQAADDREAARQRAEAERERAVAEERKRQEEIRQKEEDERKAVEAEKQRREKDNAHRLKIHTDAFTAMLGQIPGLTSHHARAIVKAIAAGLIPGVSINY